MFSTMSPKAAWIPMPSPCHALSNSFGFGGQNVSLVMSREPA